VRAKNRSRVKPIRDTVIASGEGQIKRMDMFNTTTSDKIEVRDGSERPVFSPKTGVTFMQGLNSVFDWHGSRGDGKLDMTESQIPRH